jgi:Na+/proline symporter
LRQSAAHDSMTAFDLIQLPAWLILMGVGTMLAVLVPPILCGLSWKRANRVGVIASMSVGLMTLAVFGYVDQFVERLPVHYSFGPFVLATCSVVIFSVLGKRPQAAVRQEIETGWHIGLEQGRQFRTRAEPNTE